MRNLRDTLIALDLDATKLDTIEKAIKAKRLYKVYIFYEFFRWEESIEDERFVLYTEDESLAKDYYSLLQEVEETFAKVEEAFASSHGERPVHFYTAKLEQVLVQNYRSER